MEPVTMSHSPTFEQTTKILIQTNTQVKPKNYITKILANDILQETLTQRVQSTYVVECRVSILGITIMILGSIPHSST